MKKLKELLSNRFFKSVLLVLSGTGFAQLLNILVSPVITRIYTPEEYGIYTVYTAILGFLSIIGPLRYDFAIPIAENDKKAINVLVLSLIVLTILAGIILLIFIFWGKQLLVLYNAEILYDYQLLIPVGIFFVGLYSIFSNWAFRKRAYYLISKTKVHQSIFSNGVKIASGLAYLGPIGLIIGHIIGASAGTYTLASVIHKQKYLFKSINFNDIKWCMKRYVRFPLYATPSQLLNSAGVYLPIFFLSSIYGPHIAGYYGLAIGIVNMPMNLIGNSVGDVFYGEVSNLSRKDPYKVKKLSVELFKKLFSIGLLPTLILIFWGPQLFSIIFGTNWYEAGVYAQILSVLVFSRLLFIPSSRVYEVYEKQKEGFFLNSFRVLLVILVFLISGKMSLNSYWAVGLYSIAMTIVYLMTFILAQKIINDEIKKKGELNK